MRFAHLPGCHQEKVAYSAPMLFDVHTHAFHPKVAGRVLKQLNGHYNISPVGTGTLEDLLVRLHRAGLSRAVVHTAATDPSQVIPANNWSMDLDRAHEELVAFGTMHPDYGDMEAELDRLEGAGVPGLKFHPDFQGFSLLDDRFFRLMEIIGDRFILMVHVGDNCPADQCNSSPDKLAKVRTAFPGPPIIAAHMGGYRHWDLALETLAGTDVWLDTSSTLPFVAPSMLRRLLDAHPADRVMFGSDYPLFDPGEEIERLQTTLSLSDERLEGFLTAAGKLFS